MPGRMVGWGVTEKFAETYDGQPIECTPFEDLTGLFDTTFFPPTFQKEGHLLTGGNPYLGDGLVEEDQGECTLTVRRSEIHGEHGTPAALWSQIVPGEPDQAPNIPDKHGDAPYASTQDSPELGTMTQTSLR